MMLTPSVDVNVVVTVLTTSYIPTMIWHQSHRADPLARAVADRHYSRQKPGAPQFVPPGRCVVLYAERKGRSAYWVTSWPFGQYVRHAWPGAWICSAFRNEGVGLSSEMIVDAIAATRFEFLRQGHGDFPAEGMITFVDEDKTKPKAHPGQCFLKAGFQYSGMTKGGLLALELPLSALPASAAPKPALCP